MGRQRKPEAVVPGDDLRAYDDRRADGGNVRPADDRYLTAAQQGVRDEAIAIAEAEDGSISIPETVTAKEVDALLQAGVDQAIANSRPEATPVTSPRGDDDTPEEIA